MVTTQSELSAKKKPSKAKAFEVSVF